MTYCWIKYDVRNSQSQISHLQDFWPHIQSPDSQELGVCTNAQKNNELVMGFVFLFFFHGHVEVKGLGLIPPQLKIKDCDKSQKSS